MNRLARLLVLGVAMSPTVLFAQSPSKYSTLVNLDRASILEEGVINGRIDLRLFRNDEGLTYTSLGLNFGLGNGAEGILRGTFSPPESFALPGGGAIRHGGSDIEVAIKHRLLGSQKMAWLVGISASHSAAQQDLFFTLGAVAESESGGTTLSFNPRAVMIQDNTMVGLGFGVETEFGSRMSFVADFTALVSGENTRSTTSGDRIRRNVYGAALRFKPGGPDDMAVDLGFTNATGYTTGFGLTPALGGRGSFFIALSMWN